MNRYLVPAVLSAVLMSGGVALAADASGTVKSWDAATHTLTLQDGKIYMLPSTFSKADAFKAGEKVKITYDVKDGKNMATMAEMAS